MNDVTPEAKAIFLEALDCKGDDELMRFLEKACGTDAALRIRVEELLRAHRDAGAFLGGGEKQDATGDQPLAERPGTVLGPYKLLEQIGEGGFGVVFMAEQHKPVRRKVALKVLKPGMDTRQVVARFEAERQALALMDHPNIAHVFDGGETAGGRPYFVMELVRGIPITEFCDDNHLLVRERLELFVSVCQAVQHAHQKGIIHRDLKPSNIMVTLHDGTPVVKVIDFGIAKALGQQLTDKTLFTNFAQLMGTPMYMSPEQAQLSGLDMDTRTDIYSLGVLLYELLTGTTPFDAERLRTAAYDEIRRIIREEEPPKPSTRLSTLGEATATVSANRQTDPKRLRQLFRGELDWIVMKALEKDRNRRYETASAFAADVERYLQDEPVQACPASAGYRLCKFFRRYKGPVTAGAALAVLLVLGIVGTSIGLAWALRAEKLATDRLLEITKEKERATSAETQAKEEAAIAKAVNDFLQNDLLAQAAPEKNARNKKVTVEEVLGRAAARIGGKFENQPQVEAAIQSTIGDTYSLLGDYRAAQPHLERALELHRGVLGEEHPTTLACMNLLSILYQHQAQFAKAEPVNLRAVELARRVLGEEHPDTLRYMSNMANIYRSRGEYAKAESLWVKMLEVERRVFGEEHRSTLGSMNNLASVYWAQNQLAKAEPLYAKALDVSRRVLGEEHPQTLICMNNLAGLYQDLGQFAKAEPLKVKTLELGRRVLGEEHPSTLGFMNGLGLFVQAQGEFARAELLFDEALDVSRRVLGEEHPDTLSCMDNLASLYRDQGEFSKAEPLCLKTLEIRRRVLGQEHPYTLYSMQHLGMLYQAEGQFAKGEQICRETLAKVRKANGEASPQTAEALAALGENLLKQRKYADAEPLLRDSLKIRQLKQPDNWKTFHNKSLLGGSLLAQGKHADAEPLLLAGYEGLHDREPKISVTNRFRLKEAQERLVQLYDAWGKPEKAAEWRAKHK